MTYQPLQQKSWLIRNRMWLITVSLIVMLTIFITSPIGNAVTDIAKVSAESKIYDDAWLLASENEAIIETLGTLKSISHIDIIEGHVKYTNDNEVINMSFRIIGDKNKGKLDIAATRDGIDWDYDLIKVRIKNPKEEIIVLN